MDERFGTRPWFSGSRATVSGAGAVFAFGFAALLAGCSPQGPSVEEGRTLYRMNGCASCHGVSGGGDGPVAASLPAKPTDLRNPALFTRGSSESAIAATLAVGIASQDPALSHSHHELLMPGFGHLSEPERLAIARYVISLSNDAVKRRE